jgi:hypothetical protein
MRRFSRILPHGEIDARLAEMDRQELGVHIGDVEQGDVAEGRQVIELGGRLRLACAGSQARACCYTYE